MNGSIPGGKLPKTHVSLVDVREVATAHVRCIERDEAQGKRFQLVSDSIWFVEIGTILNEKYGPMGYPIPTQEAGLCILKFLGIFSG